MKPTKAIILILLFPIAATMGQDKGTSSSTQLHANYVIFELGGPGAIYSFSYERLLFSKDSNLMLSLGAAYYPPSVGFREYWFPIVINRIKSSGNHKLELGAGFVPVRENEGHRDGPDNWIWGRSGTLRIGYRFQPRDEPVMFRAGFTPFISVMDSELIITPSIALSIGYGF